MIDQMWIGIEDSIFNIYFSSHFYCYPCVSMDRILGRNFEWKSFKSDEFLFKDSENISFAFFSITLILSNIVGRRYYGENSFLTLIKLRGIHKWCPSFEWYGRGFYSSLWLCNKEVLWSLKYFGKCQV